MIKELICLAFVTLFCQQVAASKHFDSMSLINSLKRLSAKRTDGLCNSQEDCPFDFFCKNGDCVAKRSEGDSCLSSSSDECMCGKCILDPSTWSKICFSNSYCQDGGSTLFNNCEFSSDCPDGYFCDSLNGKLREECVVVIRCANVVNVSKFCTKLDQINHRLVLMCVHPAKIPDLSKN
ncbi:hypothetical protein BpHYR1_041711 [Brachionus plicatilis]|uniref:Uncharacterized protein n=1 Tax=Brachionus plicatilis TaxID=10195 RepID=A0A3M7PWW9_BRAPC|nr:hypothetical protein BpHYR1_041711 [Brachionus plicatilis]